MSVDLWLRTGRIDDTDVRFARTLAGDDDALLPLAAVLSRSARQGHVCLTRDQLPAGFDADAAFERLAQASAGLAPVVLDGERVYLHRAYEREVEIAAELCRRSEGEPARLDTVAIDVLERIFGDDRKRADAAACALTKRVVVLTGGPGTGKTSTVVRLTAAIVEVALRRKSMPPQIQLLAPTGKAAARLAESVRSAIQTLEVEPQVRERIPTEAKTIHRALGRGVRGRPRFGRDHPWSSDVVIVDEMSMVDLELMSDVLEATRPDATLIFLGDPNQLSSVEAGSVLADLESLSGSVFHLTQSYRYSSASGIGGLASAVLNGDSDRALELLRSSEVEDVSLVETGRDEAVRTAIENHERVVSADDPVERHRRIKEHRVLCARRRGRYGVDDINARVRRAAHRLPSLDGVPLLVRRNDAMVELFNGDLGVLEEGENPVAWFESSVESVRAVPLALVPPYDDAFALSVHQSQGSEFDAVSIVLADDASALATRELLFTALTRARRSVVFYGSEKQLKAAIGRTTFRASGMADRLRERS